MVTYECAEESGQGQSIRLAEQLEGQLEASGHEFHWYLWA